MSLPRPASIFDTLEPTGMYKRPRDESGPVAVGPDVTTCSDEEFEQWLASAPRDANGAYGLHPTDKTMMSAWMTLSLAATKAQVEYTAAVHLRTDKSPDSMNQPVFRSANDDDDDGSQFRSLGSEYAAQGDWEIAQQMIASKEARVLMLVARAERVQPMVFN